MVLTPGTGAGVTSVASGTSRPPFSSAPPTRGSSRPPGRRARGPGPRMKVEGMPVAVSGPGVFGRGEVDGKGDVELLQKGRDALAVGVDVDRDDDEVAVAVGVVHLLDDGQLLLAGAAPRRPDVQQDDVALELARDGRCRPAPRRTRGPGTAGDDCGCVRGGPEARRRRRSEAQQGSAHSDPRTARGKRIFRRHRPEQDNRCCHNGRRDEALTGARPRLPRAPRGIRASRASSRSSTTGAVCVQRCGDAAAARLRALGREALPGDAPASRRRREAVRPGRRRDRAHVRLARRRAGARAPGARAARARRVRPRATCSAARTAPMHEASARELVRRGEKPTALHNNCSGKHAGLLLACRALDLPTRRLHGPGATRCSAGSGRSLARYADIPESRITRGRRRLQPAGLPPAAVGARVGVRAPGGGPPARGGRRRRGRARAHRPGDDARPGHGRRDAAVSRRTSWAPDAGAGSARKAPRASTPSGCLPPGAGREGARPRVQDRRRLGAPARRGHARRPRTARRAAASRCAARSRPTPSRSSSTPAAPTSAASRPTCRSPPRRGGR